VGQILGHRLREGNDPPERRHRIAVEGPVVGSNNVARHRRPARVGVLDDHRRRRPEVGQLMDQPPGRIGVVQVQVGQLDAAVLNDVVPPAVAADLPVPRSLLVGVFAVPQAIRLFQREMNGGREGAIFLL